MNLPKAVIPSVELDVPIKRSREPTALRQTLGQTASNKRFGDLDRGQAGRPRRLATSNAFF
jgi:hypothetical protein